MRLLIDIVPLFDAAPAQQGAQILRALAAMLAGVVVTEEMTEGTLSSGAGIATVRLLAHDDVRVDRPLVVTSGGEEVYVLEWRDGAPEDVSD